MDRRAFIGSLALGTLAAPHVARAQSARKVHRIGILSSTSATSDMVGPQPRSPSVNALLGRLALFEIIFVHHYNLVTSRLKNFTSGSYTSPITGDGQLVLLPMPCWVKSPTVRGVLAPARSRRESHLTGPWSGLG